MTAQEIFNKVKTHLLAQGRRAHDGVRCVYRAPDGAKCAVGCLIPDELYSQRLEGGDVTYLCMKLPVGPTRKMIRDNLLLLENLQHLHDAAPPDKWAAALTNVAKHFGLQP